MSELIQNRHAFLDTVASRLGRERKKQIERPTWKYQPQHNILKGVSKDGLAEILRSQCRLIHTELIETSLEDLPQKLATTVRLYGGGPLSLWQDERFSQFGLDDLINNQWPAEREDVHIWDPALGGENIQLAEKANIGITFSDITLAESGTVVLFNSKEKGRSVSLLPKHYIAIIPKSTLVPRITQASQMIREKLKAGEIVPSCINFITGPSNSADIEMNLVIGVHGPVKAAYVLVDDC